MLNWLKELSSEASTILLVKDFHKFYDDPSINRTIKELSSALKKTSHNLINLSNLSSSLLLIQINEVLDFISNSKFLLQ